MCLSQSKRPKVEKLGKNDLLIVNWNAVEKEEIGI
jgi:hypothetical protein